MDDVLAQRYRNLVETGFKNAGKIENASMLIDSKAEGVSICGNAGTDYMNIYIKISGDRLEDVRYLCSCDPAANVVVETLCDLARGLTIKEAKTLTKEQFYQAIGSDKGSLPRKVWGAIELVKRVIARYEAGTTSPIPDPAIGDED